MENFKYKVSVIVPVYNVSEYLRDCLDSLLAQTIDHDQMEVLLINDGSTDNSLDICYEYAQSHFIFKVFSKENEGLSATRNYGIQRAQGKYMMYLDSDDKFTPETVKEVTDFFDTVYDEVDLVTYKDQSYKNGEKLPLHYRYNYLVKSGVYSLKQYPFITQTRVSICVKNIGKDNYLFDTTPGFRLEDQEYCSKVLMDKQNIGYCDKGEYQYNRSNDGSIVSNYFFAYYIFESSMDYFERLFAHFEGEVPVYYQGMFLNDVIWKLNEDKLYPYHYDKEKFEYSINRIKKLLARTDTQVILSHPKLDNFQKQYWLKMKPNAEPVVYAKKDKVDIIIDNKSIYSRKGFELIMHKLRIENKQLHFMAFLKSPIYTYIDELAQIYAIVNDDNDNPIKVNVQESVHSYYKAKEKTCNFYMFSFYYDTTKLESLRFVVEFDGITYDTSYWCMPVAVFNNKTGVNSYIRDNVKVTLKNNSILYFEQTNEQAAYIFEQEATEKYKSNSEVYSLRRQSLDYRREHRIWLYYDLYTVDKDNGYYQFISDFSHDDGVERYYVYDRNYSEIEHLFTDEQKRYLVKFGSEKHKLLYVSAEYVFTAFYGFSTISPFETEANEAKYIDIIKFRTIYLQHGVLHANLKLKNHAERCRADRIVVSSYFEKENYVKNYGYDEREIITTGMARYDHIDRSRNAVNKILFAPSWRRYLTNEVNASKWNILEDKIIKSDYYIKFMEFLNDERLHEYLKKENLILEVKLHPIIKDAKNLFNIECDNIVTAEDQVDIEDYKLFITDFSSYVFDFAYLSRPIIYFVPDMDQFKSGMNHYRELDLPFEKAFGNLVLEAEDAVDEVIRIIDGQFVPDALFKERMDNFYLPMDNCAESLYQYICSGEIDR